MELGLQRLVLLVGDLATAASMAGNDRGLLKLSPPDYEMQQAFAQLAAAGGSRWYMLQLLKAARRSPSDLQRLQHAFQQLSTAGLRRWQLNKLTQAFGQSPGAVNKFGDVANGLFGGDWRAAAASLLADEAVLEPAALADRLSALEGMVSTMEDWGLQVASQHGRQRVLEAAAASQAGSASSGMLSWRVSVPEGTPAEGRRAAVEAALAAEGFTAASGQSLRDLERLVAVSCHHAAGGSCKQC